MEFNVKVYSYVCVTDTSTGIKYFTGFINAKEQTSEDVANFISWTRKS